MPFVKMFGRSVPKDWPLVVQMEDQICRSGKFHLPTFARQPLTSESTLCRLRDGATACGGPHRVQELVPDERGSCPVMSQSTARFTFRFLNPGKTLFRFEPGGCHFWGNQGPFAAKLLSENGKVLLPVACSEKGEMRLTCRFTPLRDRCDFWELMSFPKRHKPSSVSTK